MKGKKKRDRGRKSGESEEKNQGECHIFKAEIFQIFQYFQNASASGGPIEVTNL